MAGSNGHDVPGFQGRFVAELIAARLPELSELAAAELVRSRPDVASRYRPMPREKWAANFGSRLSDLSASLGAESPDMFAAQAAWSRVAFGARGAPADDLRTSLEVLRAVLAREVTPEDAEMVDSYIAAALRALESAAPPPEQLSAASRHGRLGAAYLIKILEGDRMAAAAVVHDAVKAGLPVREAYLEVLTPVQRELGRLWHLDEITVAEEHFSTTTTMMVMSQLLPLAERKPRNGLAVLCACVEGNTHELGARMVADFFEMEGWRSVHLGASVPAEDLVIAITDFRVDVVALSLALVTQLPTLERTIGMLRHVLGERCPKIVVGGPGVRGASGDGRELWRVVGADAHAESADEAVAVAERLVGKAAAGG